MVWLIFIFTTPLLACTSTYVYVYDIFFWFLVAINQASTTIRMRRQEVPRIPPLSLWMETTQRPRWLSVPRPLRSQTPVGLTRKYEKNPADPCKRQCQYSRQAPRPEPGLSFLTTAGLFSPAVELPACHCCCSTARRFGAACSDDAVETILSRTDGTAGRTSGTQITPGL